MAPEYDLIHTENPKIFGVEGIVLVVAEAKRRGKTVGLITGCFDILHKGHINLFRQAKQRVDILIVGVDRDETVRLKGSERPTNNIESRCDTLAEMTSVDFVFPIPFILQEYAASDKTISLYEILTEKVKPSFLITNPITDEFWEEKLNRARKLGIGFLELKSERPTSTTAIAEKIQKEI